MMIKWKKKIYTYDIILIHTISLPFGEYLLADRRINRYAFTMHPLVRNSSLLLPP